MHELEEKNNRNTVLKHFEQSEFQNKLNFPLKRI